MNLNIIDSSVAVVCKIGVLFDKNNTADSNKYSICVSV